MFKLYSAAMMNKRAYETRLLQERIDDHLEVLSKQIYEAANTGKFSIKYHASLPDDKAANFAIVKLQDLGYKIMSNTPEYVEISWHNVQQFY